MKKILSLLIVVCVASAMFTTTAFAAGSFYTDTSSYNVEIGEEFSIPLRLSEKTAYYNHYKLWFGLRDDPNTDDLDENAATCNRDDFNLVSITDTDGDVNGGYFYVTYQRTETKTSDAEVTYGDNTSNLTWMLIGAESRTWVAMDLATVTLSAKKAGTYTLTLEERTAFKGEGYEGVTQTITVTVTDPNAPAEPDAPVVGEPEDDGDNAKIWEVTIDGGYVATKSGVLKATLTNDAAEPGNQTQEVTLNVNGEGDATWVFNVRVTFQNPVYRTNTTLAVK